ncbi:MAG: hypothetical protein CL943_03490 [Candidatus Diapherotrites archaeon]|uniref:Uncharacterized protein n=1 Tax=Candidatus Iainarchaeum sp. TaxID=3101447 RepID=A0A2D6M1Q0_9ARCH|nr:hypothetical protein [Candidatus Diapherotrites archaeon]|tara:strand:- start:293 stop:835 length:543 start_codon:yes stop_codon:yes gene_type:complete
MPQNIAIEVLLAIIELLRLGLVTAIPTFVVVLVAEPVYRAITKRFSLSWAKASLITAYLAVTLLIMVLYIVPLFLGWSESQLTGTPAPAILQTTIVDIATVAVISLLKILITAAIYTVMVLPLLLVSTYVLEKLKAREKPLPSIANKFIAVFATSVLAWIILLFVFPFAWGGLFYLLYWS